MEDNKGTHEMTLALDIGGKEIKSIPLLDGRLEGVTDVLFRRGKNYFALLTKEEIVKGTRTNFRYTSGDNLVIKSKAKFVWYDVLKFFRTIAFIDDLYKKLDKLDRRKDKEEMKNIKGEIYELLKKLPNQLQTKKRPKDSNKEIDVKNTPVEITRKYVELFSEQMLESLGKDIKQGEVLLSVPNIFTKEINDLITKIFEKNNQKVQIYDEIINSAYYFVNLVGGGSIDQYDKDVIHTMFVDIGYSKTTISILEFDFDKQSIKIIYHDTNHKCNGHKIDEKMHDYLQEKFIEEKLKAGLSEKIIEEQLKKKPERKKVRLLDTAIKAKHNLTVNTEAECSVDDYIVLTKEKEVECKTNGDLCIEVTREDFNNIIKSEHDSLQEQFEKCYNFIEKNNIDIDRVERTGSEIYIKFLLEVFEEAINNKKYKHILTKRFNTVFTLDEIFPLGALLRKDNNLMHFNGKKAASTLIPKFSKNTPNYDFPEASNKIKEIKIMTNEGEKNIFELIEWSIENSRDIFDQNIKNNSFIEEYDTCIEKLREVIDEFIKKDIEEEEKIEKEEEQKSTNIKTINDAILNGIRNDIIDDGENKITDKINGETIYNFLTSKETGMYRNRGSVFTRWASGKKDRYNKFCEFIEKGANISIPDGANIKQDNETKTKIVNFWENIKNNNDTLKNLDDIFITSSLLCC